MPKEESEQDFDTKYFGAYKNLNQEVRESDGSVKSKKEDFSKSGSLSKNPLIPCLKRESSQTCKAKKGSEVKVARSSKGSVDFDIPGEPNLGEILKPTSQKEQAVSLM